MNFNRHSRLEGQHAFLGASKYHWVNYSDEKFDQYFLKWEAAQKGTRLHAFAAEAINLGVKLPRSKKTLNMYVNDAIGFGLSPEVVLYYSDNCFGTADAIGFKNNFLRIHDLKTGESKTDMRQLMIYMAIFCLEYHYDPYEIETELRIYQNDQIQASDPDRDDILRIMDRIVTFDHRIEIMKGG